MGAQQAAARHTPLRSCFCLGHGEDSGRRSFPEERRRARGIPNAQLRDLPLAREERNYITCDAELREP